MIITSTLSKKLLPSMTSPTPQAAEPLMRVPPTDAPVATSAPAPVAELTPQLPVSPGIALKPLVPSVMNAAGGTWWLSGWLLSSNGSDLHISIPARRPDGVERASGARHFALSGPGGSTLHVIVAGVDREQELSRAASPPLTEPDAAADATTIAQYAADSAAAAESSEEPS